MTEARTPLGDSPSVKIILGIRDVLEGLAIVTGDKTYSRAARALEQLSPGRPSIDDRELLKQVERLLQSGRTRSVGDAVSRVARTEAGADEDWRPIYARLLRKRRAAEKL